MSIDDFNIEQGTGDNLEQSFKMINYPFEMYEILVKLTFDGKFIGIDEIKLNEDFRTFKNKTPQRIFSIVNELPPEL